MKISANFSLEEFYEGSSTAKKYNIDNTPDDESKKNIINLVNNVLQPIREYYGHPIKVNSGFRCKALNQKVGGSLTSQHMNGSAADICAYDGNNKKLFEIIEHLMKIGRIKVRQLIWEYGTRQNPSWVHISINDTKHQTRNNQILYLGIK